jgi:hypothetical protein
MFALRIGITAGNSAATLMASEKGLTQRTQSSAESSEKNEERKIRIHGLFRVSELAAQCFYEGADQGIRNRVRSQRRVEANRVMLAKDRDGTR